MAKVNLLITREDGETFVIDDTVWRIPNEGLEGWHTTQNELYTASIVGSDGDVVLGSKVGSVDRIITCEARKVSDDDTARRQAEAFFLPKMKYTVAFTYMGRTRLCDGYQVGFSLSTGNVYRQMTFTWTITCTNPYYYDEEEVESSASPTMKGKFGFPYESVEEAGDYAEVYSRGFIISEGEEANIDSNLDSFKVVFIDYDGDVPSAPKFEIKSSALSGNVYIEKLVYKNESWGTAYLSLALSKYNTYDLTVDLSKSPVEIEPGYSNMTDYSLLEKGRYLNRGLNAYAIKVGDNEWFGDTSNVTSVKVTAKRLYTGV